jgi:cytoskeleton protein RodZ
MRPTRHDMNHDPTKDQLSFGRYLQAVRLEKGIGLEEIAKETRIGLGNLVLIEKEDHNRLPAAVFVKGFLRAYAKCVGADCDEVIRRYEARLQFVQKAAESETGLQRETSRLWLKLLISLAALFLLVAASLYFIKLRSTVDTSMKPASVDSRSPGQPEPAKQSEAAAAPAHPKKYSLQIVAHEKTWLKVIIDDQDSEEFKLSPGDRRELNASAGFDLLIGNAGGVALTLNGKSVPIQGNSGQVVNIHLP